jgi:AraC-like DNA-binding protein
MYPGRVDLKGVLRIPSGGAWELRRWEPAPALAPYVAACWTVEWDLRGHPPHVQATLGHPSANLVVEEHAARIYGPPQARFERTLAGRGRAVAVRFRPGGVAPLLDRPVAETVDVALPAAALAGLDGEALARAVDAEADLAAAVAALQAGVVQVLPGAPPDPAIAEADAAVALLAEDRTITRVAQLAERLGRSVRATQRLFSDYVGLGPAWCIRRYRMQEAAARATGGEPVDWAALALDLGYYDQAHLVRDFTATIGVPPARYAASGD